LETQILRLADGREMEFHFLENKFYNEEKIQVGVAGEESEDLESDKMTTLVWFFVCKFAEITKGVLLHLGGEIWRNSD
jgi:hypothetical protein